MRDAAALGAAVRGKGMGAGGGEDRGILMVTGGIVWGIGRFY